MPRFKIVNDPSEITLSDKWVPAIDFKSKDKLFNKEGIKVDSTYKGRQYRIIEKRENSYSCPERFGRGLLGTVTIVGTLGLGLFSKSVRNLFTKSKKTIRFAVLEPKNNISLKKDLSSAPPIIPQSKPATQASEKNDSKLQQELSISNEAISKIQTCMEDVLQSNKQNGIKFYNSQGNHRVFSLEEVPGLIFKMNANKYCHIVGRDDSMKARYQRMIFAQTVIRTHQLGLLVIPNAKLFTVNFEGEEYEIIAERKLDINPKESAQEQYFQDYAGSLNETIHQLAIFICKTGYSDVEWRNNPILNNSIDENGNRKIALIDIEEMDNAEIGLFGGGLGRRGLVRCVTESQAKIVEKVAEENGIRTRAFARALERRKQEIEEGHKLNEYYKARNITVGNEPIQVDEKLLNFSKHPGKAQELREITKTLLDAINDHTSKSSSENSIKGRRLILINTNKHPFFALDSKLIDERISSNAYKTDEEYYNATYLGYIVKKLIELGHIYKIVSRNGHGYLLQA